MIAGLIFVALVVLVLIFADLVVAWDRLRRKKRNAQRGRTHA
jgi:hypothetical protein